MLNAEPQQTNDPNVAVDHRFLRQAMKWLQSAKEHGAIKELLTDLGSYLVRHFGAEEEKDGFFDTVIRKAPQHQRTVEELKREHQALLAEVEAIATGLNDGPETAPQATLEAVAAFVEKMERHEQREEGLLQVAYDRDIGPGD